MKNDKELQKEIGKRVEEIRKDKMKMTKEDFAPLIGILKSYLGLVEKRRKRLNHCKGNRTMQQNRYFSGLFTSWHR